MAKIPPAGEGRSGGPDDSRVLAAEARNCESPAAFWPGIWQLDLKRASVVTGRLFTLHLRPVEQLPPAVFTVVAWTHAGRAEVMLGLSGVVVPTVG